MLLLLRMLVPLLRELVFFFYHAGQSVSDYFAIQADLLEVNANNVLYKSNIPDERKEQIYDKQSNIANRFRSISNTFQVKVNKAGKDAEKDIASEKRKYRMSDLTDTKLDSDTSGLF